MAHLTILGTGNMGQAIAAVAAKGGHTVQLLGVDDTDIQVAGDIVVLAVPYPAIPEVIAQRGESLAGKIVVDITNPLNFETFDSLDVPADSSAAAQIAAALPGSRVLKAFNTTFAATLAAGLAALQVLAHLDGVSAPAAQGATLEVELPDGLVSRRSWPAHPRCGCHWPPSPERTSDDGPPQHAAGAARARL